MALRKLCLIGGILTVFASGTAVAQDIRYISDKQFIPVRSGAGGEFRITHRGLPSGTKVTVSQTSEDGVWSEITSSRGTAGWIRAQYLMEELPAQNKLDTAVARSEELLAENQALTKELEGLRGERSNLMSQVDNTDGALESVSKELDDLKKISGRSVELDRDNRRLVESTENLRSNVDMLEEENRRLQEKLQSEEFINGALAVLMGVIITLVVPRVWPKRRKSSSWA